MPVKTINPEEKIKFVEKYLAGTISQREIGRITGGAISSIQKWICKYKAEGSTVFNKQRKYSSALKEKVVKEYLCGNENLLTLCEKY